MIVLAAVFQSRITPSRSTRTTPSPTASSARAARPLPLGLGVQPGVVDRRRRVPGQLLGERQVVLAVDAAGLGRDEADRAEDLAARDERHGDVGARRERARDLELALVEAEGCERRVVDLADEHRLARADRVAPAAAEREHRLLELAGERELERVDVLEGEPLELAVDEDVDGAPVGDPRHREPRDVGERLLVVERAAEHPAGLGEEGLPLLGEPAVLDVGVRADPADDPPPSLRIATARRDASDRRRRARRSRYSTSNGVARPQGLRPALDRLGHRPRGRSRSSPSRSPPRSAVEVLEQRSFT